MITYEQFVAMCLDTLSTSKYPFMAYWHNKGWGVLKQKPYFTVNERGHTVTRKVPKATVNAFRRIPERARKEGSDPVFFLEYDGKSYKTTGGLEL